MGNEMSLMDPGTLLYGLGSFALFFAGVVMSLRWFARQDAHEVSETKFDEGDEE
jgi:hypothetical protein